jgi:catecholate siderophore receptor
MRHELMAGVDLANEKKTVFAARTAAQGGVVPTKPTTTVGTPTTAPGSTKASVCCAQQPVRGQRRRPVRADTFQFVPRWKGVLGAALRHAEGRLRHLTPRRPTPPTPAPPSCQLPHEGVRAELPRWACCSSPTPLMSFHFSAATSFNTSGEAYSLSAANQDIPPEQSINLELGAKIDSADGNFTTRLAVFRSTKLHERNTDPLVTNLVTLSGKRHVAGRDRLQRPHHAGLEVLRRTCGCRWPGSTKVWPGSEGEGARPSLTPGIRARCGPTTPSRRSCVPAWA